MLDAIDSVKKVGIVQALLLIYQASPLPFCHLSKEHGPLTHHFSLLLFGVRTCPVLCSIWHYTKQIYVGFYFDNSLVR